MGGRDLMMGLGSMACWQPNCEMAWRTMSRAATAALGTLSEKPLLAFSMTASCCSSSMKSKHASVALVRVAGRDLRHLAAMVEQTGPAILEA